jgi:hypothetical protein
LLLDAIVDVHYRLDPPIGDAQSQYPRRGATIIELPCLTYSSRVLAPGQAPAERFRNKQKKAMLWGGRMNPLNTIKGTIIAGRRLAVSSVPGH